MFMWTKMLTHEMLHFCTLWALNQSETHRKAARMPYWSCWNDLSLPKSWGLEVPFYSPLYWNECHMTSPTKQSQARGTGSASLSLVFYVWEPEYSLVSSHNVIPKRRVAHCAISDFCLGSSGVPDDRYRTITCWPWAGFFFRVCL